MTRVSLERLYLQAWLAGLQQRTDAPPVRVREPFGGMVLLSDPTEPYTPPERRA